MMIGREYLPRIPHGRINWPTTMPNKPSTQAVRLEVHRQNHGSRKAVASETKSRL